MLKRRIKILFPFYNSYYTSTAIIIYQVNIIRTLAMLPDNEKPFLIIWHTDQSPLAEIETIRYPYLKFLNIKSPLFRLKKLAHFLLNKIRLGNIFRFNKDIDIVYPAYPDPFLDSVRQKIYWKADFQEKYFPEYFLKKELEWNKSFFNLLKKNPQCKLVLSSKNASDDLKRFYPEVKNPVFLFRFVSHIPVLNEKNYSAVKKKFNIEKDFFIVCNQYWPHKNHSAIIEALAIIKQQGNLPFQFVFTGKTTSIRGNDYFNHLIAAIKEKDLENDIIITDFLPREEQLLLLKNSLAVVQPTLFEGWSTVIEDAKALNKFVIASNIAVNKEQIEVNVSFFDPNNYQQLSEVITSFVKNHPKVVFLNYKDNILKSLQDIKDMFGL